MKFSELTTIFRKGILENIDTAAQLLGVVFVCTGVLSDRIDTIPMKI